jgi:hypothetical protein
MTPSPLLLQDEGSLACCGEVLDTFKQYVISNEQLSTPSRSNSRYHQLDSIGVCKSASLAPHRCRQLGKPTCKRG